MRIYRLTVFFWMLLAGLIGSACTVNRYAKTNRQYTSQVKTALDEIRRPLPPPGPALRATYDVGDSMSFSTEERENGQWVGTIHFNLRKPNYIIIHHTAQDSLEQTLHTFTVPHTQVSAHYVVGRHGEVYQMLNDYLRAWHAGAGKWGGVTDINSVSLGIELDNNGREPFSDAQIYSLLNLLEKLKTTYNIPATNFLAHADIAPARKIDPSVHFPWKKLAENGFGLWPDEPLSTPPAQFNYRDALRIIGYDVSNLDAAIIAFKRRYVPEDIDPKLTPYDLKVLYGLYLKY